MRVERWPIQTRIEVRAAGNGSRTLVGYASVWNALSEDLGGFRERPAKGCFSHSVVNDDIRALWNHDSNHVLGRVSAGTLRLTEDDHGLLVEIDPPASAAGFVESVQRGDVSQMSIGFYVKRDTWEMLDGTPVRTVLEAQLLEVSPVAFPAFPQTEIGLRYGALPAIPESIRRAPVEKKPAGGGVAPAAGAIEVRGQKRGTMPTAIEMRQQAATQLAEATRLDALANSANRLLTEEERGAYDLAIAENRRLLEAAQRREELDTANPQEVDDGLNEQETRQASRAPNVLRHYRRGDNEARAVAAYLRRGDAGGLLQLRASNNVPMTEGVAANGGYAVPVDHYTQIIAKRNEALLAPKLGCRRIPGKGTTVNVTTETGTNNAAILTAESAAYDRDAPGLGQVQMTLVKYTKKIDVTEELEEDNDVNLLSFIENYVGSAFAQTQNAALVAAAIATAAPVGGTVTALAGSGAAALPSDITTLVYSLKDEYADGAKFLMKKATEGLYRALTGSGFQFAPTPGAAQGEFWGYPKYNSSFVASLGLSAKCLLFGNWDYMGWREGAGLEMLRDPYSQEGRILLKYSQRFVYACLLPEAILVGQKAAS